MKTIKKLIKYKIYSKKSKNKVKFCEIIPIYIMKPTKYASREGLAAYGYEEYFRIPSVMVISKLHDTRSENRQNETKQDMRKQNAFGQLLDEAREKLQNDQKMEGRVLGYSKDGATFFSQTAKREYK